MTAKTVICTMVMSLGAFAQRQPPGIVVNLDGFRYPPIARQARIQGNVVFQVNSSGRELVSSANPLLAPAAQDNLKRWTFPALESGSYKIAYHFELVGSGTGSVPIRNKLGRFFRRIAGAPTSTTSYICKDPDAPPPAPRYAITDFHIDVFVDAQCPRPFLDVD